MLIMAILHCGYPSTGRTYNLRFWRETPYASGNTITKNKIYFNKNTLWTNLSSIYQQNCFLALISTMGRFPVLQESKKIIDCMESCLIVFSLILLDIPGNDRISFY
jgi:hypothetical protein